MDQIRQLQTIIDQGQRIVFFTGAGASTESGIPDFRSADGVYRKPWPIPPEEVISHHFFQQHPQQFYQFYRQRMLFPQARPNAAHRVMAQLEQCGKSLGVVTQNIDHLHTLAGSRTVAELHGSVMRNYCVRCHHQEGLDFILNAEEVPRCPRCGAIMKPDVVLYEEPLDPQVVDLALQLIRSADVLIICGTSLSVYPAAGYLQQDSGNLLLALTRAARPVDEQADLCLRQPLAQTLAALRLASSSDQ